MYPDFKPKFVKQYTQLGSVMKDAFKQYIAEVKSGVFPSEEHTFKIDDEIIESLY